MGLPGCRRRRGGGQQGKSGFTAQGKSIIRHVAGANGQQIAYLYFEDEPQRRLSTKRLTRDEAFLIAVNIAKLPSAPRQILKDIPRPPNTASRDD